VQVADDNPRVARKAVELTRVLCAPSGVMRTTICKDATFLGTLAKALESQDQTLQASALALLVDLSDSQDAVRLIRQNMVLRAAFRAAYKATHARAQEDAAAYREEVACIEAVEAAVGLLGSA
jgi:hypothetical protein